MEKRTATHLDRRARWAIVYGIAKSQTRLSDLKKKAQHINLTFLPVHQLEKCLDLYLIVTY